MHTDKGVTVESDSERMTLSWGEDRDGWAYVCETSSGDLTEFAFDASERETILRFQPTQDYGLADVYDRVEESEGDCFISDFVDALDLWGVPYTREETLKPLVG